ncbi:hypothetical protein QQF64_007760 [Cirrhinus molitorella]|uniref:Uncharacterized protein n=1 Tax=Cirrhinus molitorella TaxID=172907 RepID=A0ABR3MD07_9TELE
MRNTFPEGLFMREGVDGCCLMRHLTGVCTGVVLGPYCGLLVHILDLCFAWSCYWWRWFYPMRKELQGSQTCCCSTWLLMECAVSTITTWIHTSAFWWNDAFGRPGTTAIEEMENI